MFTLYIRVNYGSGWEADGCYVADFEGVEEARKYAAGRDHYFRPDTLDAEMFFMANPKLWD